MTTEAAAGDALRAKTTAGRAPQAAAHGRVASAGAGSGGRGPRATAAAAQAPKFNLKMTRATPTAVALFAKKASSTMATTQPKMAVKAPFAMAMGAKQSGGKERDKPTGLSFKGFSMPKLSQPKPKAAPQRSEKLAPSTGAKPKICESGKKTSALSAGAAAPVVMPSRFMSRPPGGDTKAPLFQLKPPTVSAPVTKPPTVERKKPAPAKEAELRSVASVGLDDNSVKPVAASPAVAKKRTEPPQSMETPGSHKKAKVGTPSKPAEGKAPSAPRALRVLNIVSPEPRRVLLHTPKKKPGAPPPALPSASSSPVTSPLDAAPVRLVNSTESGLEIHTSSDTEDVSSELIASTRRSSATSSMQAPYSFITKEEEDLVKIASDNEISLAAEDDEFVQGIRSTQGFIDEVADSKHSTTSHLLATHATISEFLLDMLTDISALAGGLQLLALDHIRAQSLEEINDSTSDEFLS